MADIFDQIELEQKDILQKYNNGELTPEQIQIVDELGRKGGIDRRQNDRRQSGDIFDQMEKKQDKEPAEKGYFGRLGDLIGERYDAFKKYADYEYDKKYKMHTGRPRVEKVGMDYFDKNQMDDIEEAKRILGPGLMAKAGDISKIGLNAAVQGTFGIGADILGESMSTLIKEATPEEAKKELSFFMKEVLGTEAGKKGLSILAKGGELAEDWKDKHPAEAMYLNSLLSLVGMTGFKKLSEMTGKQLTKEIEKIAGKAIEKKALEGIEDAVITGITKTKGSIDDIVKQGFEKGVKPSVSGKRGYKFISNYFDDAKNSVISVLKRTDKVPKTMEQFSEAIEKSKKQIWDEVRNISSTATKQGIDVDLMPTIKNMRKMANDLLDGPNYKQGEYISKIINNWETKYPGLRITPDRAEKLISEFNAASKSFWKNPNAHDPGRAIVDAGISDELRESIFNSIPDSANYKSLRKEYGSLLAIEKDVAHRALVHNRRNVKGFFDLLGDWGTADFAAGLATMEPTHIVKGATKKLLTKRIKRLNSPDFQTKKMFQEAEKELIKSGDIPKRNRYISREGITGDIGESDLPRNRVGTKKFKEKIAPKMEQAYIEPKKFEIGTRGAKGKGGVKSVESLSRADIRTAGEKIAEDLIKKHKDLAKYSKKIRAWFTMPKEVTNPYAWLKARKSLFKERYGVDVDITQYMPK